MRMWQDYMRKMPYAGQYYAFSEYCEHTFGERLYKIPLDIGCTCPNRDGTLGFGGCTFCSAGGSGEFAGSSSRSVTEQLEEGIKKARVIRPRIEHYIAYFQAFTNTYGDPAHLQTQYEEAASHPLVSAIAIATRPDCFSDAIYDVLANVSAIKPVIVELGLQTIHDGTAKRFHRGYATEVIYPVLERLQELNLPVVLHLMLGLPGETKSDFLETIDRINQFPIAGVKFHLLYLLKDTVLAKEMPQEALLTEEAYLDWLCEGIAHLRSDLAIHRITGDPPKDLLLGPAWCLKKGQVLNHIHHELKSRGIRQGCRYQERHTT